MDNLNRLQSTLAVACFARHIFLMKLITLFSALTIFSALVSCESTNSRKSGGGAFSDSHLGRQLDANTALDDPKTPGAASYDQWREKE